LCRRHSSDFRRLPQHRGDKAMNVRKLSKFGFAIPVLGTCMANAQTELAHVSGRVTDQSGAVVADTEVEIRNVDTNLSTTVKTNQDGLYTFPWLRPGHYKLSTRKPGFKTVTVTQFSLNAQDNVTRDFVLQVGSASESVTVTAETLNINTTDATVSTVVDRQFADNLPLNGRSFQSLIELTPGVLPTGGEGNTDTFVVNGQRETSNYWTVDGVSANFEIGGNIGNPGAGLGGQTGATSLSGGTNSLVSVDALQEFRIQTSTAAPDSGLTARGQISIVTRSGTNEFHGSVFDYLRNDVLDANDCSINPMG
jgi:carboxypeptidase family protein